MKRILLSAALLSGLFTRGGTYTWTGAVSSDFAAEGNWSEGVVPMTGDPDIHLVFPDRNSTVTGVGTLTVKTIVLQGGATDLQFGDAGGTLTVDGVISGAGALTSTGSSAANCVVILKGANTFSGGYFNNGGRTDVRHGSALGTGPAAFKANGKPNYPIQIGADCTIPNDITLGYEASGGIGSLYAGQNVTFSGAFTFTSDAKYKVSASYANYRLVCANGKKITFTGPVTVSNGTVLPASASLRFEQPIMSGGSAGVSFNGGGLVEYAASGNRFGSMDFNSWGSGQAVYRVAVPNVFQTPPALSVFATRENVGGTKMLDLGGFDTTLQALYVSGTYPLDAVVTSATPAALTILNDTDSRTYRGRFADSVSLVYNCPGRTLTITKGVSTTTGSLRVLNGAVVVDDAASFADLTEIEVASGASLRFAVEAGDVGAALVRVADGALLDLGGRQISVNALIIEGIAQPKGVYAAADCAWLAGEGSSVTVTAESVTDGWVWTGAAGGEWNTPGNWLYDGQPAASAPSASDTLYIGSATASTPLRVTTNTTIPNPIVLGTGRQVISTGTSAATVTLDGEISGEGGISFEGASPQSYLLFRKANAFSGGVVRNGAGQIQLHDLHGLGTGAFTVRNPASGKVAPPMSFRVPGTVTNDMTFLSESQNGYSGCIGVSASEVHLTGSITFDGDTRIAMNGGSKLYFEGETTLNGRLTLNSDAEIFFETAVRSANGNGYLHGDQGHGTWHLKHSGNALTRLYWAGGGADAKIFCEAEQVFPETAYIQISPGASHEYLIDLGGFGQTLASVYDSNAAALSSHTVTSASAATLTLRPQSDCTYRGKLAGFVSLDLQAADGKTYTLAAGAHVTRGAFRVSSGTLKLDAGTTATQLGAIEIASGAKFQVAATAGLVAASRLVVSEGGTLEVGAGRIVSVDCAAVAGAGLASGTYTRANCGWVTGDGEVRVVVTGGAGLYVWTGAAGGEWNVPGNWTVNGAVAAAAPDAGKTLYIAEATEERPFVVTQGTEIPNAIILGAGQQCVQLGFGDGMLHLSGRITGSGGLRFDSRDNAQYCARLSGAENDFVGGVRRSGAGQLQVFHANALGRGLVTIDSGSALGSEIANRTPLYVNPDCTIANDFRIGGESFVTWNGWWGGRAGATVRFAGMVTFDLPASNYETRWMAASTTHFDGPVVLGGPSDDTRLICKNGATAYFHQPVKALGQRRRFYADNDSFTGYLCASSNEISELRGAAIMNWKWYLRAPDALAGADVLLAAEPRAEGAGVLLDLGGHAQNIRNLCYEKPCSDRFRVTGATGSELTVHAVADRFFGGRFEDAVSLVYAPAGDVTFTLSNAVHTTTGAVAVTRGTLQLVDGARFEKAGAAMVTGGTLRLTEGESLNRRLELRLDGGTLQLDSGATTTVANLYFDASDRKQERGLWGAPGNAAAKHHDARIAGAGLLNVLNTGGGALVVFR